MGRVRRLARILPDYVANAWWGLVSPRLEHEALLVVHAVVLSEEGVLLAVRVDLRGWELPGGNPQPGETPEAALLREVREETGLEVEIERRVGDYHRTGFRPHTSRVYRCRPVAGRLVPSLETPALRWWPPGALPWTLFPWYRQPIEDALAELSEPVERREHHGPGAILAGMRIDLAMRLSDDRAA